MTEPYKLWKSKTRVKNYEFRVKIHELERWKRELQDQKHELGD